MIRTFGKESKVVATRYQRAYFSDAYVSEYSTGLCRCKREKSYCSVRNCYGGTCKKPGQLNFPSWFGDRCRSATSYEFKDANGTCQCKKAPNSYQSCRTYDGQCRKYDRNAPSAFRRRYSYHQ